MMNLKSVKTAVSFAFNKAFHKGAKLDVMLLMKTLKELHEINNSPVYIKNYQYFAFTNTGNEITIFIRHEVGDTRYASGYTFGIDLVNGFFDFTKNLKPEAQKELHNATLRLAKIVKRRGYKLCDDPMQKQKQWFESCIG